MLVFNMRLVQRKYRALCSTNKNGEECLLVRCKYKGGTKEILMKIAMVLKEPNGWKLEKNEGYMYKVVIPVIIRTRKT